MVATGNTSKHKDPNARVRMLDGKEVKIVLYNGRNIGHGKYFAGEVDGELVCDENNVPFYFRTIGELVRVNP
jgi:hypothetical protein